MQMGAIVQYYGYEQVVLLTFQAGVDVLAIANQLQYDPELDFVHFGGKNQA